MLYVIVLWQRSFRQNLTRYMRYIVESTYFCGHLGQVVFDSLIPNISLLMVVRTFVHTAHHQQLAIVGIFRTMMAIRRYHCLVHQFRISVSIS